MVTSAQFATITTEGGLLPSDLIARLVNDPGSLPGAREEDYRLTPGRKLREIINRSWNDLLGAWQVFQPQIAGLSPDDHTAALTWERWLLPLFAELGYGRLERFPEVIAIGNKDYPVSHRHEQALVHLVGWNVRLDRRTAGVIGAARTAPHSMIQELLNRTDEHLWAVVSNGRQLRLLRDNSSLTRAAYVEFDLEQMFSEGVFTDFVALWLLVHASRIEGDPQSGCWLEIWANEARQQGVRALDTLGEGFEEAIKTLGQGFLAHPTNSALREGLRDGTLSGHDYYRELLRVVYRIVFLLVAEDRGLLHPPDSSAEAKERYVRYFSLSRIRDLARRRRGTKHSDLWEQIAFVAGALGSEGQPALGLPALNSGLWSAEGTADLGGARLANTNLLAAVRSLAYTRQDEALHRIDYRNLGSEELGSVYESLLELQPELNPTTAAFSLGHAAGNERKTSGSYYTPTSLISSLLDGALEPVLDDVVSKASPEEALLNLKILDPACGSGHFLVAAAQRIARRLAMLRTRETDPAPEVFRHALREVIGRCIFGIDLNPMAVELCKVSLWLESVEPGKPLSFLDHHIVCGNSLIGVSPALLGEGIPDEAFKVLNGDDRALVTALRKRNKQERDGQGTFQFGATVSGIMPAIAAEMKEIDAMPQDNPDEVAAKETRWKILRRSSELDRARLAADAWCAAFMYTKVRGAPLITDAFVRQALTHDRETLEQTAVDLTIQMCNKFKFFHPELEFPEVFTRSTEVDVLGAEWSGGFSLVLGNPPWDQIQYDPREVFASSHPEIAEASTMAVRNRMLRTLADQEPDVFQRHVAAMRDSDAVKGFIHGSGRFPLGSIGRLNTAPLFLELSRALVSREGYLGLLLPQGLVTDSFTQELFSAVAPQLIRIAGFENEDLKLFPSVHHSFKFIILIAAGRTAGSPAQFSFFARKVEDLVDSARAFELSVEDFARINPNTLTCPVFRSRRDASLARSIYSRMPVLLNETTKISPYSFSGAMLFMSNTDSSLFQASGDRNEGSKVVPYYEGKMIQQFDHRFGTYDGQTDAQRRQGKLPELTVSDHNDPSLLVKPQYWISAVELNARLENRCDRDWLLAWRDVTSTVVTRTVIAAVIPRVAANDSLPVALCGDDPLLSVLLLANMNSFVFDYCTRQKIGGTHLRLFTVKQLPVVPPQWFYDTQTDFLGSSGVAWVARRVLELSYSAWDLQAFAIDIGYHGPPFKWDEERRAFLRAEIDACFFHLYGINHDDVTYIMESFPIVKRRDEAAYGEYRTARLILERYDEMSKAIESGVPYRGVLD